MKYITLNRLKLIVNKQGRKSGLVVSKPDSQLEGTGFKSHPMLDGNGVKVLPGSLTAPNPGSFHN